VKRVLSHLKSNIAIYHKLGQYTGSVPSSDALYKLNANLGAASNLMHKLQKWAFIHDKEIISISMKPLMILIGTKSSIKIYRKRVKLPEGMFLDYSQYKGAGSVPFMLIDLDNYNALTVLPFCVPVPGDAAIPTAILITDQASQAVTTKAMVDINQYQKTQFNNIVIPYRCCTDYARELWNACILQYTSCLSYNQYILLWYMEALGKDISCFYNTDGFLFIHGLCLKHGRDAVKSWVSLLKTFICDPTFRYQWIRSITWSWDAVYSAPGVFAALTEAASLLAMYDMDSLYVNTSTGHVSHKDPGSRSILNADIHPSVLDPQKVFNFVKVLLQDNQELIDIYEHHCVLRCTIAGNITEITQPVRYVMFFFCIIRSMIFMQT